MEKKSSYDCSVCGTQMIPRLSLQKAIVHGCPQCGHEATVEFPGGEEVYDTQYFQSKHQKWFSNPDVALFDLLERYLMENGGRSQAVLDVGCGNGNLLHSLAGKGFDNLYGLDVVDMPTQHDFTFFKQPLEEFESDTLFDAVVSLANIEHIQDMQQAMGRLRSLVRPGGLLVVYTVCNESLLYRLSKGLYRLGMTMPASRLYDPHHINHFSVESLNVLAKEHGFRSQEVIRRNIPMNAVDLPAGPLSMLTRLGVSGICATSRLLGNEMLQLAFFTRQ